mmetsp:Transcript_28482/g.91217  ORF Transcript_28482/g.91217 Transcript_28482/m.91217 type:complete len:153 (+) Transcript_28482:1290-1748(+)
MKKVMRYIQLGKEQGATLLAGGGRHGDEGYYVEPTVFGDVQEHHDIWNDEIFGPVMSIAKFSDLDDVIARANRNAYGLAAGVISNDLNQVNTLTRGLRAGTVWVNTHNVYDAAMPFGGYKQSGIGRDKGEYALENYLEVKTVAMPMEGAAWK